MPTIDLPIGPVDYRDLGPKAADAPVAVFVHGFLVNAALWDPVAEHLAADGVRCILPGCPLGCFRFSIDFGSDLLGCFVVNSVTALLYALGAGVLCLAG